LEGGHIHPSFHRDINLPDKLYTITQKSVLRNQNQQQKKTWSRLAKKNRLRHAIFCPLGIRGAMNLERDGLTKKERGGIITRHKNGLISTRLMQAV
jgi:hypothetical protein